jgi:hypothetical protein
VFSHVLSVSNIDKISQASWSLPIFNPGDALPKTKKCDSLLTVFGKIFNSACTELAERV